MKWGVFAVWPCYLSGEALPEIAQQANVNVVNRLGEITPIRHLWNRTAPQAKAAKEAAAASLK